VVDLNLDTYQICAVLTFVLSGQLLFPLLEARVEIFVIKLALLEVKLADAHEPTRRRIPSSSEFLSLLLHASS